MVQIAGKYKLVENKNFYEFLVGVGIPEDKAQDGKKVGEILEVIVDGKKITSKNSASEAVSELVVDAEVEEKVSPELVLLSTTKLNGNVVTVTSTPKDRQHTSTRTWTFTDGGLESHIATTTKDGKPLAATRIYKRV